MFDGFTGWPVDVPPGGLLRLSGRMTDAQVGTAVAVIADSSVWDDLPALDLLRAFTDQDEVAVPGGLRLTDTSTGAVVEPGCCFGLESWRDWAELLDGETPWLGHDPTPEIEFADGVALVRVDGGDSIRLPLEELPAILTAVRNDLTGFLSLTGRWADAHAPHLSGRLVKLLDRGLRITLPV
ncbi:hypothetical protein [Thermomonospora cellulosilytica]|uniref:Uncharacterized protein n=1 Tax=Thermomonospora cellulosilytica TaxID=1411118 RepID=A0A7W3MUW9_9ACTN|nr:hypothetical protein [Thermomonospora cellulosilytica]MBA9002363.1 hypothetical protein [Thermomonospora cellulosilytica]